MNFRLEQSTSNTIRVFEGNEVKGHLIKDTDGMGRPGWRWAPWSNKREGRAVNQLVKAVRKATGVTTPTARALIERDLN